MNLKPEKLRRLRAYVSSANATMGQIPRPVPPRPQLGADGPTFDTRDLYLSYSRLPADLQELAAISHAMCETALECQSNAATHAFVARCLLMANLVQPTDLANEQDSLYPAQPVHEYLTLVPDELDELDAPEESGESGESGGEKDPDDQLVAAVERDVEVYMRRRLAQRDAATATEPATPATAPATAVEPTVSVAGARRRQRMVRTWAASATVVAAMCAVLLVWQHLAAPGVTPALPSSRSSSHSTSRSSSHSTSRSSSHSTSRSSSHPSSQSINQTIQAGALTAIISHTERINNTTQVHVQVVNFSSEPAPASLSLGPDDSDPPAEPAMVPARSTQHRVLRVREDRDWTKAVKVQFLNGGNMVTIEP